MTFGCNFTVFCTIFGCDLAHKWFESVKNTTLEVKCNKDAFELNQCVFVEVAFFSKRDTMKKIIGLSLVAGGLAFAQSGLMGGTSGIHQHNAYTLGQWSVEIGTGGEKGTYYAYMSDFAKIMQREYTITPRTTAGSAASVRLLQKGFVDGAVVQDDILEQAYNGLGVFASEKTAGNLTFSAVASLYTESLQIIVRADSDIHSVKDLKGKRVSIGESESGVIVEAEQILVETDVGQGSALAVVDMVGDDVVALYKGGTGRAGQVYLDILVPLLFGHVDNLDAVDVGLALVVVRIDNPKVVLEVLGRKCDVTTDVVVGIVTRPIRLDVRILSLRPPRTYLRLPVALGKVEVHPCVSLSRGQAGTHPCTITAFVAHRSYSEEFRSALSTHETIDFAINAKQTVHRLLLIVPMLGGSIVEVVVGRPEREVRVIHQQGDAGQAESRLLVRDKIVRILCVDRGGCNDSSKQEEK